MFGYVNVKECIARGGFASCRTSYGIHGLMDGRRDAGTDAGMDGWIGLCRLNNTWMNRMDWLRYPLHFVGLRLIRY